MIRYRIKLQRIEQFPQAGHQIRRLGRSIILVQPLREFIELPPPIDKTITLIGNMTVPLMLLMLGASLSRLKVASFGRAAAVSAIRIGGGALVGVLVAMLFDLAGSMKAVLILQSANPVAVYNYLFAQRWNNEPEEVAGVVVLSTVASILTIPLLLAWLSTSP